MTMDTAMKLSMRIINSNNYDIFIQFIFFFKFSYEKGSCSMKMILVKINQKCPSILTYELLFIYFYDYQ